jgi:hypothetical protein
LPEVAVGKGFRRFVQVPTFDTLQQRTEGELERLKPGPPKT